MPIYHYAPAPLPCKLCGDGFDHHQATADPPLNTCPTCGQTVTRIGIQTAHTPKLLRPLSVSEAKNLGFTVFKKTSAGEFERQ